MDAISHDSGHVGIIGGLIDTKYLSRVFAVLFTIWFSYYFSQIVYLAFFSPLSKFPGPFICRFSRLPMVYHIVTGDAPWWISNLHKQYGDVVRYSTVNLSFASGRAFRDIYGHHGHDKKYNPKDPRFYRGSPGGGSSLIDASDEDHTRMRKIFNGAFSDRALKEQESLFQGYIDLLVRKLKEHTAKDPEAVIDLVKWYNYTTFDIMGDLTFGEPLGMLEDSEYIPWVKMTFAGIKRGAQIGTLMSFSIVKALIGPFIMTKVQKQRDTYNNFSIDRVNRRLTKDTANARPDIWSLVLRQEEGKGLSATEMHKNATVFMLAGTETTATLISGLTFYLLKNPATMSKLTHEIRSTFKYEEDMTITRLQQLGYLHACIEEALRIYPPVPTGFPRKTPLGGNEIDGIHVPENTSVAVTQLACYRNERNFKQADKFIPERWLPGTGFETDDKSALQPFHLGPRNCIGKSMAYHEMRLIIARMLWNFDLKLSPECEDWHARQKIYTLWEKIPLKVQLIPLAR